MSDDPIADRSLTVSWDRAADAPAEVRAMTTELAAKALPRFRSMARAADARIELLIGDGRSLWVSDELIAHEPAPDR